MWDSVIIGSGSKSWSACKVSAIEGDHSISEDSASYWIGGLYLDLGMTVFKNTDEGARLTQMIKNKEGIERISAFLDDVLLLNISRDKLRAAIDRAINRAFSAGCDAKAAEVRHALGI